MPCQAKIYNLLIYIEEPLKNSLPTACSSDRFVPFRLIMALGAHQVF